LGHNWIEDDTCTGVADGDPGLGPLADNGGPTKTHALGDDSGAIDNGDDAICSVTPINNVDQRGVVRPQGKHCDIGAYEKRDNSTKTTIIPPILHLLLLTQ
jgi:hypothetical protein